MTSGPPAVAPAPPAPAEPTERRSGVGWLSHPLVFLGLPLLGLTALYTRSIIAAWADALPFNSGDPAWFAARLMWNWQTLRTAPLQLADSNIFYPLTGTAFYAHLVLPPTLLFGPLYVATGNPILSANAVLLASVWLNGFSGGLLAYRWTGDRLAAFAGGAALAFSPLLLQRLWAAPLVMLWWMPLALLFVDAYCWRPRLRTGVAAVLCLWAQFITALYLNFYAVIACLLYLVVVCLRRASGDERPAVLARRQRRRVLTHLLLLGALFVALVLPFALGYLRVAWAWDARREPLELIPGSASPLAFLNPDPWSWLYGANPLIGLTRQATWNHEKTLFPGFAVAGLALLAAWRLRRGRLAGPRATRAAAGLAICLSAAVLSLGPYLVLLDRSTGLPLPYLPLHLFVPGFAAMRAPARFALMAVPTLAVLAALSVAALRSSGRPGRLLAWLAVAALLVESARAPYPTSRLVDVFAEDDLSAIASGSGPLVWLPLDEPEPEIAYLEAARMVQDRTLRPMVNGYGGYLPPSYRALQRASSEPPDEAARIFARLGVGTVVLDKARLDPITLAEWEALKRASPPLARDVSTGQRLRVYELGAVPPASGAVELTIANRYAVAGSTNTLWMDLANTGAGSWIDPAPDGAHRLEARWRGEDGAERVEVARAVVPLYVLAGERASFGASVPAPSAAGSYRLTVRIDGFEAVSREIAVVAQPPTTSRTVSPSRLAASVWLDRGDAIVVLPPRGRLRLAGGVANDGGATWLSRVGDDPVGAVRIGYRWLLDDGGAERELVDLQGRIELGRDLYPGESTRFRASLHAPPQPGCYRLRIGPVAEGVAWLGDLAPGGRASVDLRVRIAGPSEAAAQPATPVGRATSTC